MEVGIISCLPYPLSAGISDWPTEFAVWFIPRPDLVPAHEQELRTCDTVSWSKLKENIICLKHFAICRNISSKKKRKQVQPE